MRAFIIALMVIAPLALATIAQADGPPPCAATDCDCVNFACQEEAQAFHDQYDPQDEHRLDGADHDGIACESLPHCISTPGPTETATPAPTATETPTPVPTATVVQTATPAPTASPTPSLTSTAPPSPTPAPTLSLSPTPKASPTPIPNPPAAPVIVPPTGGSGPPGGTSTSLPYGLLGLAIILATAALSLYLSKEARR